MINTQLLSGPRVRLAALEPSDAPTIAHWYNDVEFMRMLDARPAYPQTTVRITDWLADMHKDTTAFVFGIHTNDVLIGYVALDGILWTHQSSWLAIGIGESAYREQGYGREAMQLVLQFGFQELNLHRIQLTVYDYNQRAAHLYETLGFVREGTYREMLHRDGQRYDMHLYGLLRREWTAK